MKDDKKSWREKLVEERKDTKYAGLTDETKEMSWQNRIKDQEKKTTDHTIPPGYENRAKVDKQRAIEDFRKAEGKGMDKNSDKEIKQAEEVGKDLKDAGVKEVKQQAIEDFRKAEEVGKDLKDAGVKEVKQEQYQHNYKAPEKEEKE